VSQLSAVQSLSKDWSKRRELLLGLGFKSGLRGDREVSQGFMYVYKDLSLNWSIPRLSHESKWSWAIRVKM
jgi:hypothetical protein